VAGNDRPADKTADQGGFLVLVQATSADLGESVTAEEPAAPEVQSAPGGEHVDAGGPADRAQAAVADQQPTSVEPATVELAAIKSATTAAEPTTTEPTKPTTTEPTATEPTATEPGITKPTTTKPTTTEPDVSVPDATKADATEPGTTEPGTTEPGASDAGTHPAAAAAADTAEPIPTAPARSAEFDVAAARSVLAATRPISRVELRAMLAAKEAKKAEAVSQLTEASEEQPARDPKPAAEPAAEPAVGSAKKGWRAPGLDGVRALAVLAVLGFHEGLSWLPGGFLGVDIFFVLSGFLITDLLVAKFGRDGNVGLSTFWQRRARRLLPALALMLLTVTAAVTLLEPAQRGTLPPALLGAVTYTSNWWQAFTHVSYFSQYGPPPVFQHLWSLAVEEQFYLIWPLVLAGVLVLARNRWVRISFACAAAAGSAAIMYAIYLPGKDPSLVYYGTDTHAAGLLIGAAIALTWPLRKVAAAAGKLRLAFDIAGAIGLLVLAWSVWHFAGSNPFVYPYGLVIASLAAGGLVLASATTGYLGRAMSWAPLRWLGIRSYGIYLWHWPVIAITVGLYPRAAGSLVAHVVDAVVPIAIAAASWRWLEEPILRKGLRAQLAQYGQALRQVPRTLLRSPGNTAPALLCTVGLLALASTAGYGLLNTKTGPTLQQQIQRASTYISSTQPSTTGTNQPTGQANPFWLKPGGVPYRAATKKPKPAPVFGAKVVMIGDSVMLASAPELAQALPGVYINAEVSRAMIAGIVLVQQLATEHRLRQILIVGLGTNGPITLDQIQQLRAAIGPSRWLLLVNTFVPRPWETEVNSTITAAVRRYPNVMLINWHDAIEHHTNLLWSDGIHPMPIGGTFYAKVVRAIVRRALRHPPRLPARSRPSNEFGGFLLHASYARPS
jgi:peptidoglycan/LPS O-acetylase OafA/YrhL